MELICPSCEARYQVPETSVGEKGRQVSCMNCGHSWHAFPPLMLGSSAAPPTTASPGIDYQAPPRPGRSATAFSPNGGEAPGSSTTTPSPGLQAPSPARMSEPTRGTEPSRSEQLAEIREMLAEVQSEERAAAALAPDDDERTPVGPGQGPASQTRGEPREPGSAAGTNAAAPTEVRLAAVDTTSHRGSLGGDEDEDTDPLRRRMAMHDRDSDKKRTDVERLRRRHDRRTRRQDRARDIGSGAFFTGFLLVVMIAAAMTALYMLQPQIVARMPGTEPMLTEYVRAVDGLRVSVAEAFESTRDWVLTMLNENA